ncbi:hypothetical protein DERP_003547 [Dermatophagoides pteronyssinus]|uniref:Uncharacterized protein n=1 Tax=Dermatophagoides pteronyssinus TaxID=6956 RepID=A0ABQ8JL26_DERPT|nr:hypothetical protein DERP_003547 [Dermatophagoides pteronyssinus]
MKTPEQCSGRLLVAVVNICDNLVKKKAGLKWTCKFKTVKNRRNSLRRQPYPIFRAIIRSIAK